MMRILCAALCFVSFQALAVNSLSYSGRLVNANGSPVTGTVSIKFNLSYTNNPTLVRCSKTLNLTLASGVFHTKLDYSVAECGGTNSLTTVLSQVPAGESIAIQVTDLTNNKAYAYQAIYSIPYSIVSATAKNLDQMNATVGQVLKWDGTTWAPATAAAGASGTMTGIQTGTGLAGGPITTSGTISIANGGVGTNQLADGSVSDIKVATGISRSKMASGMANYVVVNDSSGFMSQLATLPLSMGGTGATSDSAARTALGLGTASVADVGFGSGNVLSSDAVPTCFDFEKLQMAAAPTRAWRCVVDQVEDATKLPLAGGTMSGPISMGSNKIIALAAPTASTDAANKAYVDSNQSSSMTYVDDNMTPKIADGKVRSYIQSKENAVSTGPHGPNCGGNEAYVAYDIKDQNGDPIPDQGFCIETTLRSADSWENARQACAGDSKRLPREFEWQIACERSLLTDASDDWEWGSSFNLATTKGNYYNVLSSPVTGECATNFWYLPAGATNSRNSLKFRCAK